MQLMDRHSLADVSPVQMMQSFEGGVWMVWQYRYGMTMFLNGIYLFATGMIVMMCKIDNVWQGRCEDARQLCQRNQPSDIGCAF